ncbi:MAG: ribosomal protein S18-alanine N-acetyltransferase [Lachnospiraceae bacterium]|nr:ribosomal protein S18-alanine N-acetyltransferase [Lachnospiraceae bacterium]
MQKLKIRHMTEVDITDVSTIENESFSMPWSNDMFKDTMEDEHNELFVAEVNGEVAGYIDLWCVLDEATIANIAVANRFRRQNIATSLMEHVIAYSKDNGISALTLEVRRSNEPAIKLYEKFGFEFVGIRPDYYEKPKEDAIIMWKYFH